MENKILYERMRIMPIYIELEDLAANAFVTMLGISSDNRFVSYKRIEAYGSGVVKFLKMHNKDAVLNLSNERTTHMLNNYSDIFEEVYHNGVLGLRLKDSVTTDALIEKFLGYPPLEVLKALINEQAVEVLKHEKA